MREYGFSVTRTLPYKNKIVDFRMCVNFDQGELSEPLFKSHTAQKMKFSIKEKRSLMENFIFCAGPGKTSYPQSFSGTTGLNVVIYLDLYSTKYLDQI